MNYFVFVKNILGVTINEKDFKWSYGTVAPKTSVEEYNKCLIKINVVVKDYREVFDKSINKDEYGKYHYFFGNKDENKIYYERDFFFNSKLRFSIEVEKSTINVIVSSNYLKYISHRFMNLHSLGYMLTDITSGLLLMHGYCTIHCSAVNFDNRTIVFFAPPNTGKTLTAMSLCKLKNVKFIAEDFAITDGEYIYAVPWTSTFRYYDSITQSKLDGIVNAFTKKIPLLSLFGFNPPKSIEYYLGKDSIVEKSKITDIIVLEKGDNQVLHTKEELLHKMINLNKYEFNYHKAPAMVVMNYFNNEFSLDKMFDTEKTMLNQIINCHNTYIIRANNALDYSTLIREKVLKEEVN